MPPRQPFDPWYGQAFGQPAPPAAAAGGLPQPGVALSPQSRWYANGDARRPFNEATRKPVFDMQVAMVPSRRFPAAKDAKEGETDSWLEETRNYLVGQAWEMEALLKWSESWGSTTITPEVVRQCSGMMHDTDPVRLDRDLWSWVNLNQQGTARNTFRNAPRLQEFEAWRRVVVPLKPKTVARRHAMHTPVHNPPKVARLVDATDALQRWDHEVADYLEIGGQDIDE